MRALAVWASSAVMDLARELRREAGVGEVQKVLRAMKALPEEHLHRAPCDVLIIVLI